MPSLRQPVSVVRKGTWRWMLILELGSRTLLLVSGGATEVSTRQGRTLLFLGGMETAGLVRSLEYGAGDSSIRHASFQVLLDFDLALDVAQGHSLFAAKGELSQWWEGTDFEDRRKVLRGVLREPAYGALYEAFSFSLVEHLGRDRTVIPGGQEFVSTETWPRDRSFSAPGYTHNQSLDGQPYIQVIGAPWLHTDFTTTGSPDPQYQGCTPALLVEQVPGSSLNDDYRILITRGHTLERASRVQIINATDPSKSFEAQKIEHTIDRLGQPVSLVTPFGVGIQPNEGDELYCCWYDDTSSRHTLSIRDPHGPGGLRGLGDVIRWALLQSTLKVDVLQLERLAPLNTVKVDTFINAPISPWEWARDNLLRLAPVSIINGPDGFYIAFWQMDATDKNAVAHLEAGRDCDRSPGTPVVYTDADDIINEVTLRYARNLEASTYARSLTLTARRKAGDPTVLPSLWCKRSQALLQEVRQESHELSWIYDAGSASQLAEWRVRMKALPRRRTAYLLHPAFDWLRPGDVITITDPELHWSRRVCHVETLAPRETGTIEAGLLLFETLTTEA